MTVVVAWLGVASAAPQGSLVWTGIDYGLVRMVGTRDFREPEAIFPGYLDAWNGLFVEEQLDDLQRQARVAHLSSSLGHLAALHAATRADEHVLRDDSFPFTDELTRDRIYDRVASYELGVTEGTALTLIADQLNKPNQLGCFWVVSYDVASREIHRMERDCRPAHGFGFRNYWFGSVKGVVAHLEPLQ